MEPMGVSTSTAQCAIHRTHTPAPTYTELHHIVPQAWQALWQPPHPWSYSGSSPDRAGLTLWDARTVTLCRTGHGNVHYWLVAIMREIAAIAAASRTDPDDPATRVQALIAVGRDARAAHRRLVRADVAVSVEAINRYTAVGGKLAVLIVEHEWGEI